MKCPGGAGRHPHGGPGSSAGGGGPRRRVAARRRAVAPERPYRAAMSHTLQLTAVLEPRGPAGAFVLTDEQVADLGAGAKAFPVALTVNGVTLALRLARMGGENLVGLAKAARAQAGVELGESYEVTLVRDEGVREVEVPADLTAALAADPAAEAAFAALAPSHRKEFVRWVTEAKREQTRILRVEQTVEMVGAGRTR